MKQRQPLVFFALLVAIVPVLGIPESWKAIIVSVIGILLAIIASTLASPKREKPVEKEKSNDAGKLQHQDTSTQNDATVRLESRKKIT